MNKIIILTKNEFTRGVNYIQKKDANFNSLVKKFDIQSLNPRSNYFESLVRSIVYQQLNTNVASSIFSKFLDLFDGDKFPKPVDVANMGIEQLRQVGISINKSSYIVSIARTFEEQDIFHNDFKKLGNSKISEKLKTIRGIGQWTADMFLIFTLNRPDVLPLTDLGIKKGMAQYYNLDKLPSEEKLIQLADKWRPYRSIGALYMWELADSNTENN